MREWHGAWDADAQRGARVCMDIAEKGEEI